MKKELSFFISTFFKLGYFPKFPGTITSFVASILSGFLCYFFGLSGMFFATLLFFFLGNFSVKETLKYTKHDPNFIVIDEVIGQFLTFVFCAKFLENNISYSIVFFYFLGFILFRIFDIFKMGPIKWIDENLENAIGVILDDVFAGIFSGIILFLIYLMFY